LLGIKMQKKHISDLDKQTLYWYNKFNKVYEIEDEDEDLLKDIIETSIQCT
jgi:hypothetical protein